MLGIQLWGGHWRLEVKTQPLLNSSQACALCEIQEQNQVEHNRRCQDRIPAKEIDFDLHRIAEPAEDVDVVPALFVVSARRIVVDADLVEHLSVKLGIQLW